MKDKDCWILKIEEIKEKIFVNVMWDPEQTLEIEKGQQKKSW